MIHCYICTKVIFRNVCTLNYPWMRTWVLKVSFFSTEKSYDRLLRWNENSTSRGEAFSQKLMGKIKTKGKVCEKGKVAVLVAWWGEFQNFGKGWDTFGIINFTNSWHNCGNDELRTIEKENWEKTKAWIGQIVTWHLGDFVMPPYVGNMFVFSRCKNRVYKRTAVNEHHKHENWHWEKDEHVFWFEHRFSYRS